MNDRVMQTWASVAVDELDKARPLLQECPTSADACRGAAESIYRAADLLRSIADEHRKTLSHAHEDCVAAASRVHPMATGGADVE